MPHLNTTQAAEYLGLKPATLAKWRVEKGEGEAPRFKKISRRTVLYDQRDLDSFMAKREYRSTSEYGLAGGAK